MVSTHESTIWRGKCALACSCQMNGAPYHIIIMPVPEVCCRRLLRALQHMGKRVSPAITAHINSPQTTLNTGKAAAAAAAAAPSDTAEISHYVDGLMALAASARPPRGSSSSRSDGGAPKS
jgi:hypothetical protein